MSFIRSSICVYILTILATNINAKNLCIYEDPIKSCECYFDGQHFSVQCVRTSLDQLPDTSDIPNDIELFDVSNNRIQKLEFNNARFEAKLMRVFRAANNKIELLPTKFLQQLPHLTSLDLSHNEITNIEANAFDILGSLHYLDLSFNDIHTLPDSAFARTRALRYLDLSYNNIGEQLMSYKSLNSSKLGFNENMNVLKLNAVNLTQISNVYFENLSLLTLSLADNAIEQVPLLPTTLVDLDLSGNDFTSIAPRHLVYPQLKTFKLNRMKLLESIENYAFYNLISLEFLEIEHCPLLKSFNDKAFGVLHEKEEWNLTRISLNGNSLRKLNETYFFLFNKVKQVDLSSNPWICDCGVIWFKWIKQRLINKENMRCVAPKRLRNQEVMKLDEQTLPKCNVQSNIRVQKILTSVICVLVVVLLGIIMYLIYLAPYKHNRPDRYIGMQSPYSTIQVHDDI